MDYVGALLITDKNEIILQQRDKKRGIMNPGMVTTFGGLMEEGETREEGLERELQEELELKGIKYEFWRTFEKKESVHGEDRRCHIYIVREVDPQSIEVKEGMGFVTLSSIDDLSNYKPSVLAEEIVRDFFLEPGSNIECPYTPFRLID